MFKLDLWNTIIKPFWPIWLILAGIIIVERIFDEIPFWRKKAEDKKKFKRTQQWLSDKDLLQWLKGMKPAEFETYTANLFSSLGYKTSAVGKSYDGGVDVIAEKNGIKYYIQCKKYNTSSVGVKALREFYGVLVDHASQGKGIFITTDIFTSEAEYFAQGKPIELVDGPKLIGLIHQGKS